MGATPFPQFRIATWNFLSGGSKTRATHYQTIAERIAPDLMMTQECKAPPPSSNGRKHVWSEVRPGRWGTALLSRDADVAYIDVGFGGWVTGGEVRLPGWLTRKRVRAFSIHCPAGDGGYIRTMHRMIDALLDLRDGCDLVLAGDFNVAVGFRGADELVKMSPAERALLARLVKELDVIPCWQTAHRGVPLAQTLRWTGNRAAPYHCDGIFVPRRWQNKLISCDVLSDPEWTHLSDHNPVVAVFRKKDRIDHA
jgi:exonuclease III